ncbi:MAG: hypothetical protein WCF78_02210 [archaeon]
MVKYITANVFLTAFLILLIVLMIAFFGVMAYDNYKKSGYEEDIKLLNQQMVLDDLFMVYVADSNNTAEKCDILEKQYNAQYNLNRQLLSRLRQINENALVPTSNYIKYMYVLTNVKLWMYHKKLNIDCDKNKTLILYFYSETIRQGKLDRIKDEQLNNLFEDTLNNLSDRCNNVNVFVLPYNKEIIILNQIISDYNVNNYPAIVIDKNVYYNVSPLKDFNCE